MEDVIPGDIALQLCQEIREENARKRFGAGKMQCKFCYKFGRDNPEKLCIFANEQNRGCSQVNKRYDKRYKK